MESPEAIKKVNDLFNFNNLPLSSDELQFELNYHGLSDEEFFNNPTLLHEAGVARNYRIACEALGITITSRQAMTLAKHLRVGDNYKNGIPLSEHERYIAQSLLRIQMQEYCRASGVAFSNVHEQDVIRMVNFGERGLHIGHKIGEATGCFQSLLICIVPLIIWLYHHI